MKIRSAAAPDKTRPVLLLAADVSKDTLHLYSRFPSGVREVTVEDVVPNRTEPVEQALTRVADLADEHGLAGVRVLCEASGGYERLYLAVAERLGIETALVSPEQVGRLTKVESLDTGKTDKKDARVIHLAGQMGKARRCRDLPEPYVLLRRLTAFHDDEVRLISMLRQRLHAVLTELFPDYDRQSQFTCVPAGFPNPAVTGGHVGNRIDLHELVGGDEPHCYFVRVQGESMVGAGIHDGDICVVNRAAAPRTGEIVVAVLDGDLTVKRFVTDEKGPRLLAENPDYPPIWVERHQEAEVWGVVAFSLRDHRIGRAVSRAARAA